MRSSLLVALAAFSTLTAACADPGSPEESASSEGAATATARAALEDFAGAWKVTSGDADHRLPASIVVTVTDDAVDPTTGVTKGTRLRMMRADEPTVPAIDRAPFLNVDEGKGCENVAFGGGESITVCHTTTLEGRLLTHTVTIRAWKGYIFPAGWSSATQTMQLRDKNLEYTYTIDGKREQTLTLTR